MFGPKLTTVFASRWRAIWFSASMLMLAYCTVPSAPPDPSEQKAQGEASYGRIDVKNSGLSPESQKQLQQIYNNLDEVSKQ
jgi:hypothetical protein